MAVPYLLGRILKYGALGFPWVYNPKIHLRSGFKMAQGLHFRVQSLSAQSSRG